MQTTIVGFPRLGKARELKFALEKYFRGEISEAELLNTSNSIQLQNWKLISAFIDITPCGDFSLYDNMLDVIWLIGAIPDRYLENKLTNLQKYFSIARGYQSDEIDLKAFEMKKWFNTNYHYIVPKLSRNLSFRINDEFFLSHIRLAKSTNMNFKVSLIGPFTFLKLSKTEKEKDDPFNYTEIILKKYLEVLNLIKKEGIKYIQIEEPSLVTDLSRADRNIFRFLYQNLLKDKEGISILLQTYFGYIDNKIYNEIMEMDFDGVGLDLVSGIPNISLLMKTGFSKDKILIAGIINGANVWKSDYKQKLTLIEKLHTLNWKDLWISSSCSLLHIPYSLEGEDEIPEKIKQRFSFAGEKLVELKELKELVSDKNPLENKIFIENQKIINDSEQTNLFLIPEVRNKIKALRNNDFKRCTIYRKRKKIQKENLRLPELPTTTIGSFPQTEDIRRTRKLYREGKISNEEYETFIKEKINEVINLQERIGLDVLVHGEYERNDMVEYFAQFMKGIITTKNGWVQSYGSRATKPPIIYGDIARRENMTVKWITYAQSLTKKPLKAILTGPVTLLNWSFVREDMDNKSVAYQLALAIREEIEELQNNKIKIIQVDEAALREKLPLRKRDKKHYLNWAINSFKLATSGIKPEVQLHTHMCYSEFGDIARYIEKMDVDVITIEAARSELSILKKIKDYARKREIGPGIYDIHSPRIPSIEEIKDTIMKILTVVPLKNLWLNPDCGLKTRRMEEVIPALENIIRAKKEILNEVKK